MENTQPGSVIYYDRHLLDDIYNVDAEIKAIYEDHRSRFNNALRDLQEEVTPISHSKKMMCKHYCCDIDRIQQLTEILNLTAKGMRDCITQAQKIANEYIDSDAYKEKIGSI